MNISDEMLMLRALEPTDLDVLYRWENDERLWLVSSTITPFSRKQLWDYIENYDGDVFKNRQLRLMIQELSSGVSVGTIDLYDFDPVNSRASVGILIDEQFRGMGLGAKAMKLFEKYCYRYLSLNQLVAIVALDNYESINLFETLGYRRVGVLKWWLKRGDEFCDAIFMQLKLKD